MLFRPFFHGNTLINLIPIGGTSRAGGTQDCDGPLSFHMEETRWNIPEKKINLKSNPSRVKYSNNPNFSSHHPAIFGDKTGLLAGIFGVFGLLVRSYEKELRGKIYSNWVEFPD